MPVEATAETFGELTGDVGKADLEQAFATLKGGEAA